MAKRPRQHELEELSRRAFRSALPAGWISREQHPDYGIDEQVQIGISGIVTPLIFGVQLKGTDGVAPDHPSPNWSFVTSQLRDYLALPFPVLLVLYDAQGQRLWYRWVHEAFRACSPEDLRAWMLRTTVTITFNHLLTAEAIPDIQKSTERFRDDKSADAGLAFEISVSTAPLDDAARVAVELFVAVLARTSARDVVRIVSSGADATISIRPDQIIAEGPGTRFVIPINATRGSAQWSATAVAAVIACTAVLLAHRRRARTSLQLLAELTTGDERVPNSVEEALCGWPLPLLLGAGNSAPDLLNAAAALLEKGAVDLSLWLLAGFVFCEGAGDRDHSQHQSILRQAAAKMPPSPRRGAVLYSLANALRARSKHRWAVSYYRRAALDAPEYRSTTYWWHELGGCLFLLGKVRCSAAAYARALSLPRADPHSVPLLADALIRTGQFQQANTQLSAYLNSVDRPTPSGILLQWFVSRIVRERQDGPADRDRATALLRAANASDRDDDRQRACREALIADPLYGDAHYNLGLASARRLMTREASEHFLAAALSRESDAEAWAYAILMLAQADPNDILLAATLAATQLNAESINFQISAKLSLAGRNAEDTRAIVDSFRQMAERTAWLFSYPPRSALRLLASAETGFEVNTGDVPPRAKLDR
jgi:tetratricopeptide (TPR) repeat protein